MSVRRTLFALLVALAAAFVAGGPAGAASVEQGCGSGSGLTGSVTIDSPAPNASVSGTVEVRGTASAGAVGVLDRVEATLGGASTSGDYPRDSSIDFSLTLDVSNVAPGRNTLTVTACGPAITGVFARGAASVPVVVKDVSPTSTSVARTTTTDATGSSGSVGAVSTGATTTSTSAGTAAGAAVAGKGAVTSTTATSSPTTTTEVDVPATATPPARAEPRARTGSDRPVVLTETPATHGSGKPLWVGAVVGISGVIGVMFSAATWRRRAHVPEYADAVDPEPVDSGDRRPMSVDVR